MTTIELEKTLIDKFHNLTRILQDLTGMFAMLCLIHKAVLFADAYRPNCFSPTHSKAFFSQNRHIEYKYFLGWQFCFEKKLWINHKLCQILIFETKTRFCSTNITTHWSISLKILNILIFSRQINTKNELRWLHLTSFDILFLCHIFTQKIKRTMISDLKSKSR